MKILLLGGAGLIGSQIYENLNKQENEVMVADSLLYCKDYLRGGLFKNIDIGNRSDLFGLINDFNPDVILHFAGIVGDEACRLHPKKAELINFESVKWLSQDYKGRIIFPSSCSVYGANTEILNEDSVLNPLSLYGEQKVRAEEVLKQHDNALILRLGTIHGYSHRFRNDLVVNTMTLRALKHKRISVYGGNQWRPLIHVNDVARTVVSNIKSGIGIFNISRSNYKISELAQKVCDQTSAVLNFEDIPFEDERNYRVDTIKAQNNLIFTPYFDVDYTISSIIKLYNSGAIKDISDISYSNVGKVEFII